MGRPVREQIELLFDLFAGRFGQPNGHMMGIDPVAVIPDQGGDDVQMGVGGILMPVHQIGLFGHFCHLHEAVGNGRHFLIGEVFSWAKIERHVQHFKVCTAVFLVQLLKTMQLVVVAKLIFVQQKIARAHRAPL